MVRHRTAPKPGEIARTAPVKRNLAAPVIRRVPSEVWTGAPMPRTPATSLRAAIAFALGLGLALAAGACDAPVFSCSEHRDCDDAGQGGVCEANGFCSFATRECASGRAFGDLAPFGIAGRCVPLADACTDDCDTSDAGDPSRDPSAPGTNAPQRDVAPEAPATRPGADDIAVDETLHCSNRVRDAGESDVDCGGGCVPCDVCRACAVDDDCGAGTCDGGTCRTIAVVQLDGQVACAGLDDLPVTIAVPPGEYVATALPSAASKWNNDNTNGGDSWTYRIDCTDGDLDELRSPGWFATPAEAFAALETRTTEVIVGADGLRCGLVDSYCPDNRGVIAVQLATACP